MAQFPWPDGKRCAVALTFDEDGECVPLIYDPENANRRLTLQSEATYGPNVGIPRILDLLDQHGIRASFFIPGFIAEHHPDLVREMIARGHEVGHHGYLHERPDFVDEDEEERIMIRGLEVLESITGVRPVGYRSPAWELKPTSPGPPQEVRLPLRLQPDGRRRALPDRRRRQAKAARDPDPVDQRRLAALRLQLDPGPRQRHLQPQKPSSRPGPRSSPATTTSAVATS